ncbi:MAG TPA: fused MFS/spermidine synthase, partial [Candidatus Saccharimonadales bacterium]|nr:fused MFS/spermidine synthase [Candidatus Saccharimonadales bacterium]
MQIPFAPGPERPGAPPPDHEEALPPIVIAGVAAAIAVSGLGALLLEVCWTRTLSLVFGSSTHAFTLMLTTFLVGLAAGSAIAGRLLGRVRDPVGAFALAEIGAGLAVFTGTFLFPELPYGFLLVFEATRGSPGWFDAGRFALAASIMLVPTLLLGATFPLAVRCARMGAARAAQPVGFLYSVNTLGAIAGSLAAGFLLIPFAGLEQTLIVGALVSVTIGAFLLTLASGAPRAVRWVLASVLFLLLPALPLGAPRWNPVLMTSGIFQYAPKIAENIKSRAEFIASHTFNNQLFYRDGMTATVTVEKRPSRGDGTEWLVLTVNGKVDASTVGDMETQVLLGHLPVLIGKNPRRALVVGWGSGITAGSLLTHPEIESVRAVEIEPAVIQASTFFHDWNGKPEQDPRMTLEINDARHDMLVDPGRYDVIISEPSNPWLSGPARLFTREFFEMARAHLAPGGLLCQWVQMYGLDVDSYLTLLRTLSEVFDDVMVFRGSPGDTIVLAGTAPISLDLATIHKRLQVPAVAADLRRIHVTDLPAVLSHFKAGGKALRALVGPGRLNTDDNADIEFAAARTLYRVSDAAIDALLTSTASSPLDAADFTGLSDRTRERMPLLMAREWMNQGLLPRARAALAHATAGAPAS